MPPTNSDDKDNQGIFIRNAKRKMCEALNSQAEQWQSEHERLGVDPIDREVILDSFMHGHKGGIVMPVVRKQAPMPPPTPPAPAPPPVPLPVPVNTIAGSMNQEQTWLDTKGFPSVEGIPYNDVPSPPIKEFTHDNQSPLDKSQYNISLSDLNDNEYCLIFDGEQYISASLKTIEDAVEKIMTTDRSVNPEDLLVIKRLKIKVGVSIV